MGYLYYAEAPGSGSLLFILIHVPIHRHLPVFPDGDVAVTLAELALAPRVLVPRSIPTPGARNLVGELIDVENLEQVPIAILDGLGPFTGVVGDSRMLVEGIG